MIAHELNSKMTFSKNAASIWSFFLSAFIDFYSNLLANNTFLASCFFSLLVIFLIFLTPFVCHSISAAAYFSLSISCASACLFRLAAFLFPVFSFIAIASLCVTFFCFIGSCDAAHFSNAHDKIAHACLLMLWHIIWNMLLLCIFHLC